MSKKLKPSALAAALNRNAKGTEAANGTTATAAAPSKGQASQTRQGKVMISSWLPIEVKSSLRLIQAKHPEKLTQDLVAEAMNDLFAKYNVPQVTR